MLIYAMLQRLMCLVLLLKLSTLFYSSLFLQNNTKPVFCNIHTKGQKKVKKDGADSVYYSYTQYMHVGEKSCKCYQLQIFSTNPLSKKKITWSLVSSVTFFLQAVHQQTGFYLQHFTIQLKENSSKSQEKIKWTSTSHKQTNSFT